MDLTTKMGRGGSRLAAEAASFNPWILDFSGQGGQASGPNPPPRNKMEVGTRTTRGSATNSYGFVSTEDLRSCPLTTQAALGGVVRVGTVGGSDQLVVVPANQGQPETSISTTRHIPRPPQHDPSVPSSASTPLNTTTMQHVKVSDPRRAADLRGFVYRIVQTRLARAPKPWTPMSPFLMQMPS